MLSLQSAVFLTTFLCIYCDDKFLPSYIKPCNLSKEDFSECIKEQISIALPEFTKGIPELGVPSTDPVDLDDIHIDGNGLKLTFTKAKMHGLGESKLTKLNVILGKQDESFTLAFKSNLQLKSKYEVDGRILILPIQGKGDALVNASNCEVTIESKLVHVKDDKGEHLKLITPKYKYDIEKTTFDLKNLFNGNKQLAETTIQFANQNWQQLMDELAPPAIKQIVKTIVKAINKFFSNVTLDQIFTNYEHILASRG